jgi:hypothetical protein
VRHLVTGSKPRVGVARSGGGCRQGERRDDNPNHRAGPAGTACVSRCTAEEFTISTAPQALDVFRRGELELKVFSVIWNDGGDEIVMIHRTGSCEISLKRLAKGCL